VAVAMVAGGVLLGILPAIGTYFLTCYLFGRIRGHHPTDPAPVYDALDGRIQFKDRRCAAESCVGDVKEGIFR